MELVLLRQPHAEGTTLGRLYIDGQFVCDTLEDPPQDEKIMHKTRIPYGTYNITLRTVGGFHERYLKRFPDFHKGMLWLRNVPNFEYILIHIGNTADDSSGCILVGQRYNQTTIVNSTSTYERVYKIVLEAIEAGEKVTIQIIDND